MKNWSLALIIVGVLAAIGVTTWLLTEEREVTLERVKEETNEAFQVSKEYARQQQERYLEQIEQKLEEVEDKIEELQERTANQLRAGTKETIAELERQRKDALGRVGRLREASSADWEQAKIQLEEVVNNLQSSYERAMSELPGEEAPDSEPNV